MSAYSGTVGRRSFLAGLSATIALGSAGTATASGFGADYRAHLEESPSEYAAETAVVLVHSAEEPELLEEIDEEPTDTIVRVDGEAIGHHRQHTTASGWWYVGVAGHLEEFAGSRGEIPDGERGIVYVTGRSPPVGRRFTVETRAHPGDVTTLDNRRKFAALFEWLAGWGR